MIPSVTWKCLLRVSSKPYAKPYEEVVSSKHLRTVNVETTPEEEENGNDGERPETLPECQSRSARHCLVAVIEGGSDLQRVS